VIDIVTLFNVKETYFPCLDFHSR